MKLMENTPVISIERLRKFYGEKQVLRGIDLSIYPGQIIGYIGPNGAGKSTTVKILAGLIPDFEGEIRILGKDPRKESQEIKREIGYVPENAEMYDVLTPFEYLDFIGKLYGMPDNQIHERIDRMLDFFGLFMHKNQRMDSFSKGMRQKVLLISGLLHNPKIIFLDEPLSGLDANTVIMVKDLFARLAREGKTIFYCSHMMDTVEKISDRILLINDGVIEADGTFRELRQEADESLERIFSKLTGHADHSSAAESFIKALNK